MRSGSSLLTCEFRQEGIDDLRGKKMYIKCKNINTHIYTHVTNSVKFWMFTFAMSPAGPGTDFKKGSCCHNSHNCWLKTWKFLQQRNKSYNSGKLMSKDCAFFFFIKNKYIKLTHPAESLLSHWSHYLLDPPTSFLKLNLPTLGQQ